MDANYQLRRRIGVFSFTITDKLDARSRWIFWSFPKGLKTRVSQYYDLRLL